MLAAIAALSLGLIAPVQERPREVWGFRSVLDQRPRMLTLALHKDLWVAYDATFCSKHTTSHGPQPTSEGTVLVPDIVDREVLKVRHAGSHNLIPAESRCRAYRLDRGSAVWLHNSEVTFESLNVTAYANGFLVELTEPLAEGMGGDPGDYHVTHWRYEPSAEDGGPKVDEAKLRVHSVTISRDRKQIFLELKDLKPGYVVHLRLSPGLASASGKSLSASEARYTLNRIPNRTYRVRPITRPANQLTAEERRLGFKLLFDGKEPQFRGWRRTEMPGGWQVTDGTLQVLAGGGGGNIVTLEKFSDFELRLEWMVTPGANSGIFFRTDENRNVPWETGPEMQILDDELHPNGQEPKTSAGSDYALMAPAHETVRPPGYWNEVRIIARGPEVEYWLNGARVVRYVIGSMEWEQRVRASGHQRYHPDFGRLKEGHIVLQDHGHTVSFRSIRIRRL